MDNNNRPHLNLGTNDTRMAPNDRTYPTTPSTFPQPVFPGQQAGGAQAGQQYMQPGNYYQQNQYASHYTPGADYGFVSNIDGTSNDPNTGLAHQFAHQNIGGQGRASPYGSRGPSPAQRPRTSGNSGQQQAYGNYLSAPSSSNTQLEFAPAPERNPDKYGPNANNNQKKCSQLASDFFKDSVKRARERNQR